MISRRKDTTILQHFLNCETFKSCFAHLRANDLHRVANAINFKWVISLPMDRERPRRAKRPLSTVVGLVR